MRTASGFSVTELARRVGVSKAYISDIEKGREPSIHTLAKIAEVLGVDWRELAKYSYKYSQLTMSAEEFRGIRLNAGLTQEQLAYKLFKVTQTISNYENGWPIPRWRVNAMRGIVAGKK